MTSNTINVWRVLTLTLLSILSVGLTSLASGSLSWVQEVSDAVNPLPSSFRIQTVASEDDHLIGRATYHETGQDVSVKIDGFQTPDGRFWPSIAAETANDPQGNWQRVDQPKLSGRPVTYTFEFAEANVMLYFNLDAFRSLIGTMRYGRIVLPTGKNTLFELKELLPLDERQKSKPEDDWESTTLVGYLGDPLVKSPFFIAGFSFEDGHLRADCGYLDPETTSATVIDGTKTPKKHTDEADFWASATLQVANDPEGEWQTVGQSATPGKPTKITIQAKEKTPITVYVGVDMLRPMIGKFGYGRAVLKNGKAAAFEMKNLLPPSLRR
jgi:hypothetical protein